ncbi:MAG: FAD-dependent oxidoreductase [Firmicutes bacterium]|nr:FAD-dependent oxidoreductase [Bacillota bacterium]
MPRVVVIGGGWAGCAAAVSAAKAGAEVVLLERLDMVLGTGLVGGIFRNNGRFTAAEEAVAMGGGELIAAMDAAARHAGIEFPGHQHSSLYDVYAIEGEVRSVLNRLGIEVRNQVRVSNVQMDGPEIRSVSYDGQKVEGDVFVECTGTVGGMPNCTKYGNGCVMCIMRCPTFGNRVSVAAKAGVQEVMGYRKGGQVGVFSGSCKLQKDSLARGIVDELEATGRAVLPVPSDLQKGADFLGIKACQQYALPEYVESIVLLDTGPAKLMTSYYPLEILRSVPGFERARYEDPYAGSKGNSIRYLAISPRDDALKVEGVDNLFCAGEKSGPLVGHTEAIVTGLVAGHNAVRAALGMDPAILPRSTTIGESIAWVREEMENGSGLHRKYTYSGSVLFDRMKELDLYQTDPALIRKRVQDAGVNDIFDRRLC